MSGSGERILNPGFQIGKEEMEISQNEKRKECGIYKMEYGIRKEYGICKEYGVCKDGRERP